jgi:hypothetical protein
MNVNANGSHLTIVDKEQFWFGTIFGMVVMFLITLGVSRIVDKDAVSQVQMPHDIISSYNMGIKDALRTNPPSQDLEYACLDLWANKQK